jgi:hypothetical protein
LLCQEAQHVRQARFWQRKVAALAAAAVWRCHVGIGRLLLLGSSSSGGRLLGGARQRGGRGGGAARPLQRHLAAVVCWIGGESMMI